MMTVMTWVIMMTNDNDDKDENNDKATSKEFANCQYA